MSLDKINENNENNEKNNKEIYDEKNMGNNKEDKYVKNNVDYSSYELSQSEGDGEDEILIDHDENDLNELALLGFFNDFALIDIGIHDLIREIYFED